MKRHLFSILAIPMVFLAQCAPQCAPQPGPGAGDLRQGTFISIGAVETYGFGGHVGVDWLNAAGTKICPDRNCGYWALRNFQTNGGVDGGGVPVDPGGVEMGRIEFYPDARVGDWGSNDAWNTGVPGGLHVWNPDGRALNGLRLPFANNGAFHFVGSASAGNAPVADGRLRVYAFQLVAKDGTPGAFNISTSRNSQWTAGYIWPATYILELGDNATGRTATACVDIAPGASVHINVSAANFGLPGCPF
ncbi:MAG TPA: hypothetical protein VFT09_12150 [Ilumatobacteraceae bacterium]|nr:hypothetical protein [Ilumatobacteraceae bacterium]